MDATTSSTKAASKLQGLVAQLSKEHAYIDFAEAQREYWSPKKQTVFYNPERPRRAAIGVLHELAHAILEHKNYGSDFELLQMEAQAWTKAAELGQQYGVKISDDHIQNCLDTYRHWLYKRSHCPDCSTQGIQKDSRTYRCGNCQAVWSVTSSRFRRPYRLLKTKSPENKLGASSQSLATSD